jgi:hypothetical protein
LWGKVANPELLGKVQVVSKAKGTYGYEVHHAEPLKFINVDVERHALPKGIDKLSFDERNLEINLTTTFSEQISGECKADPIIKLGVNFYLDLTYEAEGEVKKAMSSWHLDKSSSTHDKYCHPIYHFTFGGMHMTKNKHDYGQLLLLSSPRINHPPLNIILACDFIIRNFYAKDNHKKITNEPAYKMLIESAKSRYWKYYSEAFHSKWDSSFNIQNLPHDLLVGHS